MIPRHVCNRFNLHDDIWEILDIFDRYSTRFGLVSVALFETIAVAWVFKLEKCNELDRQKIQTIKPKKILMKQWQLVQSLVQSTEQFSKQV
ncbi:uncharacterized protein LOC120329272 isoform X1 [Styela clava]